MQGMDFVSGNTYIISETINFSGDKTIPSGVTLVFQGGKFESDKPIVISGPTISKNVPRKPSDGVVLVASSEVIFGKNITITGFWVTNFATPLWFEPNTFQTSKGVIVDFADSINKAIKIKGKGCVYLSRGTYYISKPIYIPQGITLKGDFGQLYDSESTIIRPTNSMAWDETTSTYQLKPFSADRMVYVNIDSDGNPLEKYSNTWCAIQGISFINDTDVFPNPVTCRHGKPAICYIMSERRWTGPN